MALAGRRVRQWWRGQSNLQRCFVPERIACDSAFIFFSGMQNLFTDTFLKSRRARMAPVRCEVDLDAFFHQLLTQSMSLYMLGRYVSLGTAGDVKRAMKAVFLANSEREFDSYNVDKLLLDLLVCGGNILKTTFESGSAHCWRLSGVPVVWRSGRL